ncbi:hypothetical protein MPER_11811 [Moniliophthora perniciosa FA553]|nr:hypothetical protein MPER_11811 [Moniliophthora perniciosa FA553]
MIGPCTHVRNQSPEAERRSLASVYKEGIKNIEQFFRVPLDHGNPSGGNIYVLARSLRPRSKAKSKNEEDRLSFRYDRTRGAGFAAERIQVHERGYQVNIL